jgi:tetratricopeptide (TPR) repeat protein
MTSGIPSLSARLAHEIPKPKDWQAFQRNCVLLFRAELRDPTAQEYGRSGQKQRGIDVLGARGGNADHYVGVQCRLIQKPLREKSILEECRAALEVKAGLKEIIFATTAPDDTGATDAAITVEQQLRAEGHDLRVAVYGWGSLQTLIATHELAYAAFCPWVVATSALQSIQNDPERSNLVNQVIGQIVARLRQDDVPLVAKDIGGAGHAEEDPALHARIDVLRDLYKDEGQPRAAQKQLRALLDSEHLAEKPWACFRIETNLGSIACDLGQEAEAATHFEAAYQIRPEDPAAIGNLALARLIQGRFTEAMEVARSSLVGIPPFEPAVGYLLQAAAKSDWQGEPETLVPDELAGSVHADLGLADFLRRREVPGWEARVLELTRRHPDVPFARRIGAVAVLSLALNSEMMVAGARGAVTLEEINSAADWFKEFAERCIDVRFGDLRDLAAHLNNAALLLRLAGRHRECERLLERGLGLLPDEPSLRRLQALAQAALGRPEEALRTLATDADPENAILAAELTAEVDPALALTRAVTIDSSGFTAHLAQLRWGLIGELSLRLGDAERLQEALNGLRAVDPNDLTADLLEIRRDEQRGQDKETAKERLSALSHRAQASAGSLHRFFLAGELRQHGLHDEVITLLTNVVDLSRVSAITILYLQSLAEARRDTTFRKALADAGATVSGDPSVLWIRATHAWNVDDMRQAQEATDALIELQPDNARARLLRIEVCLRQGRSVIDELGGPLEDSPGLRKRERFRLASLLNHFGYRDRAAALAYKLFLENRDDPRAWMTLSSIMLFEGTATQNESKWNALLVQPDAAIDLRYDDGEQLFLVVEPSASLRNVDSESWEPSHPLVSALIGLGQDARFKGPDGREGTVVQLRHKYVARLHHVLDRYESRFPEVFGVRRVSVDFERDGGLDRLLSELKARADLISQEEELYKKGNLPLAVLAHRVGVDSIDAASGLVSRGLKIKAAVGLGEEREAAATAIHDNAKAGCVFDLYSYWIAFRLQALDSIRAICGPVYLPQSVMDRLRSRHEKLRLSAHDGLRTAGYEEGRIVVQEIPIDTIKAWIDDLERAIAWTQANANVSPVLTSDTMPNALTDYVRAGLTDVLDGVVVAIHLGKLLVSDDLPTRSICEVAGGRAASTHQIFQAAVNETVIDRDIFAKWTAELIGGGHNYIGVSSDVLIRSLRLDIEQQGTPGRFFKNTSSMIGGADAEPQSHISVCLGFVRALWDDPTADAYRAQVTGQLLTCLLRGRQDDHLQILRRLVAELQLRQNLVEYIRDWARGHFIIGEI